MKCKIAGREVELDIEGRVSQGGRDLTVARKGREGITIHRHHGSPPSLTFTLTGQLPSGKNGIKTTRTGKRYPTKRFEEWRDMACKQVYGQRCKVVNLVSQMRVPMFRKPTELCIEIHYAAGDLRRRDIPGMMDALFHVLERAQVVGDDAQIKESHWYQLPVDRSAPGVTVTLREVEQ